MKARCVDKIQKDRWVFLYEFFKKILAPIFIGALMIGLIGCGGGSGDGDGLSTASAAEVQEGAFVDSPVQGLHYETDTQSGTTGVNGEFYYMEGETVTFSMGDVVLGEAMGASVMTPIDMVPDATDETHPTVTNMLRFIQTLDEDNNPDNGIFLPQHVMETLQGRQIQFDMDTAEFENDVDIQMFMDTIRAVDALYAERMIVPEEDAQLHMRNTMIETMSGNVIGGNMQNDGQTMSGNGQRVGMQNGTQTMGGNM
jgi:hypothetical protein